MSIPAATNRSASHKGIANKIDTAIWFCNAQVLEKCVLQDRCVSDPFVQSSVSFEAVD